MLSEPVSIWGGVDRQGTVVDVHHPDRGTSLVGVVLVMRDGRGSSSSASVLAELVRSGHGPAAVVLTRADLPIVLGALVAAELYGRRLPVVTLAPDDYAMLRTGQWLHVDAPAGAAASIAVNEPG